MIWDAAYLRTLHPTCRLSGARAVCGCAFNLLVLKFCAAPTQLCVRWRNLSMDPIITTFDNRLYRDEVISLWKEVFGYEADHKLPQLVIDKKLEFGDGFICSIQTKCRPEKNRSAERIATVLSCHIKPWMSACRDPRI